MNIQQIANAGLGKKKIVSGFENDDKKYGTVGRLSPGNKTSRKEVYK